MFSLRTSTFARSAAPLRRSLQTSAARYAGKESAHGNENRAAEIDKAKQEQLRDQKKGTNKHDSRLASDSEDAVKADQADKSIKEMQDESASKAQQEKK